MVLDRSLADADIRSNILIGVTGKDERHDLALSRSETRDATHGIASRAQQLGQSPQLTAQPDHLLKQSLLSGKSVLQLDFRWLASVAHDGMAPPPSKREVLERVRVSLQISFAHAVWPSDGRNLLGGNPYRQNFIPETAQSN
jgi:hypothetical protein